MGNEEFFEPLTLMEPESRRPPWTRILSIPREQETYHTRVILFSQNVSIILIRQRPHKRLALTDSDLQRQYSTGPKPRRRLDNQFFHQLVPIRACEERHFGIVPNFARKLLPVFGRHVREICDNQIDRSFDIFKEIAF